MSQIFFSPLENLIPHNMWLLFVGQEGSEETAD